MARDVRFGLGALSSTVYRSGQYKATNPTMADSLPNSTIISARVKHIILDDSNMMLFNKFGGWDSIGIIFWEAINSPIPSPLVYDESQFALPIFSNTKHYPLLNEIIYLVQLTNNQSNTDYYSNNFYYFPPLNIWQSTHHNTFPSFDNDPNQTTPRISYNESIAGGNSLVNSSEDNISKIDLGKTFKEKPNLHSLLPYEGDIIHEGRWGNSIRFGSTVKNPKIPNNWSSTGDEGSPLTIIRNGQADYDSDPWVMETEDINKDMSSIYLTSTQKLPLFISSVNKFAFNKSTAPTNVSQYISNQIILNSGRIVLNAKTDSIILSANRHIQLTCNDTLGIDAKQVSLAADSIYLGDTTESQIQPLVLGNNLNDVLSDIATLLNSLNIAFSSATDSTGAPIVSLNSIACDVQSLSDTLSQIIQNKSLLSKTVKTK
jgi:hypothetical protein